MVRGDSHLHTPRHPLKTALKYPFYRRFISNFDACLAVGKWSREYYQYYGAKAERIFFVPHVINDEFFIHEAERLSTQRCELRQRWNLREDAVVFGFVGKFIEKKRPLDFVGAINLASQQNPAVAGLMIGDGELRIECEKLVAQKNIPIEFTGFLNQSQIIESFIAMDALILPSDGGETWGLVVNEAMACGRPCIVSDQVGCGPDLIISGQTGAVFPLGNREALSKIILDCAADCNNLREMGTAALHRVKNCYSMEVAINGVIQAVAAMQTGH